MVSSNHLAVGHSHRDCTAEYPTRRSIRRGVGMEKTPDLFCSEALVLGGHGNLLLGFAGRHEADGDREKDGIASTILIYSLDDAPFRLGLLRG